MGQDKVVTDMEQIAAAYRQYMESRSVNEDEDITDAIVAQAMDIH